VLTTLEQIGTPAGVSHDPVTGEMREELKRQADLELGERTVLGSYVYIGMIFSFILATPFEQDFPKLTLAYIILVGVLSILRLVLTLDRRRLYAAYPKAWRWTLMTLILTFGAAQGFLCGFTFQQYGVSNVSLASMLITVGIAGGAIASYRSHVRLLRCHLILLFLPALVTMLFLKTGPSLALAFLVVQVYYGLRHQGNMLHKVYWKGIVDNMLLELRQRELEAARNAAESANRAKSEFLAGLSHEIRTPMNAILGMADVLWNENLTDSLRNQVGIIRRAGQVLLNLINDILDLSKIEAGRLELEQVEFDFKELVQKTAEMMASSAKTKGLEISCSVEEGIPSILGDPYRLRQILTNLLSNAIKFTEKGAIRIWAGRMASEGPLLKLQCDIADTGIGIAKEKLLAIFESFTQADSSTTRKYGGTGLGLTIAQRLAQMMGGRIEVRSEVGEGSVFSLAITAPAAAVRKSMDTEKSAQDLREAVRCSRPLKILLVEDNEENQMVVRAYLEGTPFQLDIAGNGAEGLEKFKSKLYDLTIMDIRMPVMDGYEAIREMRKYESLQRGGQSGPVPILALTASVFKEDYQKITAAGFSVCLMKPILRDGLLEAILRHAKP
jgi:signal transduction histidine kinase